MKKKKGVMKLWQALMMAIMGIFIVLGITGLVLYLTGELSQTVVDPEDISFSDTLADDDLGYYDSSMSTSNTAYYKVASDFSMTITSSTEGVTNDTVTLSLSGGTTTGDGYITDGVIIIPQVVTINKAFTVTLVTNDDNNTGEEWTVGGISLITAVSENVIADRIYAYVYVDVPVYDIQVRVTGNEDYDGTQEVVANTNFTFDVEFVPENSKYVFSTSEEKEIFYEFSSSYISYDYDADIFTANGNSGSDTARVTVYTFSNSYYQNLVMNMYSAYANDRETLTEFVLAYFNEHTEAYVSKIIEIKVVNVTVDSVTVGSAGNAYSGTVDKYFTLTAKNADTGDATLDLSILDSQRSSYNSLFGNVGIRITSSEAETNLKISGGKVIKVVTDEDGNVTISQEDYDSSFDYVKDSEENSGTSYYILANNTPSEYSNYYWLISAEEECTATLNINFFMLNDEGVWENFFEFDSEQLITITFSTSTYNESVSWSDTDAIELEISYDSEGNSMESSIDLSALINSINSSNVYTVTRYFIYTDDSDLTDYLSTNNLTMNDLFDCSTSSIQLLKLYDYQGELLTVEGDSSLDDETYFYELSSSVLTAKRSFVGTVKVVVAIIKTNVDDVPVYDDDGNYIIVNLSRAKEVAVDSTLSIANMEATFSFDSTIEPNEDYNNNYYISAINVDEDGTQTSVISFKLVLSKSENLDGDSEKILQAYIDGTLKVVCYDSSGNETTDITLQNFSEDENARTDSTLTFVGTLVINEDNFSAPVTGIDRGKQLFLKLEYNDGKEDFSKNLYLESDENVLSFYIYYQQPVEITGAYESNSYLYSNNTLADIDVEITSEGCKITWGNYTVYNGDSLSEAVDALNTLLTFSLTDQFGKTIDSNAGIYSVRFVEDPGTDGSYILGFNSTLTQISSFASAEDETTTLTVYIVDSKNDDAYVHINGSESEDCLTSDTFTFNITSEGVSKVEVDTSTTVTSNPTYTENSSISYVQVSKYVKTSDSIDLRSLVQIYVGESESAESINNYVVKLASDFVSSLSSDSKSNLEAIFQFNNSTTNFDDYVGQSGTEITNLRVLAPFNEDTTIRFTISDSNYSLYEITLEFTFKQNAQISDNFSVYANTNDRASYLVSSTSSGVSSVFADETYLLSTYLPITSFGDGSTEYSWTGTSAQFSTSRTDELVSITSGADGLSIVIGTTYQFQTVTFTIYYGSVVSSYALHTEITLYVNPNLIVRATVDSLDENPLLNLKNLSYSSSLTYSFGDSFGLYKATSYIDNGEWEKITSSDLSTISFTNTSSNGTYITVGDVTINTVGEFTGGEYSIASGDLYLNLGEVFGQSFVIYEGSSSSQRTDTAIYGILMNVIISGDEVIEVGDPILCEQDENGDIQFMTLSLTIGYGGSNDEDTINEIFTDDIPVVTYNGETYLILLPSTTYNFNETDNISISLDQNGFSGSFDSNITGALRTSSISGYFSDGNSFVVKIEITSGDTTLSVYITMNAIISGIGEAFFYYDNDYNDYNIYGDGSVDFATLLGEPSDLEEAGVSQTLEAGNTYTILHDDSTSLSGEDIYGFYYNISSTSSITVSIESMVGTTNGTQQTLSNLATLSEDKTELTINHISTNYEEVYIVLKAQVTHNTTQESFVWYYRIQVNPSFSAGEVNYPYAQDVEYLDTLSSYYISEEEGYEIDLSETFTQENSRYAIGSSVTRFKNPVFQDGVTYTADYSVYSVSVNGMSITENRWSSYISYSFNEDVFNIKVEDTTAEITVVIAKTYYVGEQEAIGSVLYYTFAFNQGSNYTYSLTKDNQTLTATDGVYTDEISAGSEGVEYTVSIGISSDTVTTPTDFGVYISGSYASTSDLEEALSSALQSRLYIQAGAVLTATDGSTITLEYNYYPDDWTWGTSKNSVVSSGTATVTIDGTTYSVSSDNIQTGYVYLSEADSRGNRTLIIKPRDIVDQDYVFEIGFYTEEKVVFKLSLTVVGVYEPQLSSGFTGGETYNFVGTENSIFTTLGAEEGTTITSFTIQANNGDATLNGVALNNLVKITNDSGDYSKGTIMFAHLTETTTFTFTGIITDSIGNTYTFNFEIEVAQSFDLTQNFTYTNQTVLYDNTTNEIYLNTISTTNTSLKDIDEDYSYFNFKIADETEESGYTYNSETTLYASLSSSVDIDRQTSTETKRVTYTIAYLFNSGDDSGEGLVEVFTINLTYTYYVTPNITATVNYPQPDASSSALTREYIGTTESSDGTYSTTIEKFFGSSADFASAERIAIESKSSDLSVTKNWTIRIESMDAGLTLSISSVEYTSDSITANDYICSDAEEAPAGNYIFTLDSGTTSASITFLITVNNVTMRYYATIVQGSNVLLRTYMPNSTNSVETVYAEDLASYSEQTLFAESRILNYQLKTGGTYYVKFQNSNNATKIYEITGSANSNAVNLDLGESLIGYTYVGTYLSYEDGDVVGNAVDDSTIFLITPNLTARVVIVYYDGTKITQDATIYYTLEGSSSSSGTDEKLSDFTMTGDMLDETQVLNLSVKVGSGDSARTINITGTYSLLLQIDFEVTNNADEITSNSIPYTEEIEATDTISGGVSLLSLGFGIKSVRTGENYTAESMAEAGGTITLQEYGFSTLKVVLDENESAGTYGYESTDSEDYKLALSAGKLHTMLVSTAQTNSSDETFYYYTGLLPRSYNTTDNTYYTADDINEIDSGSNTYNYIVVTGNGSGTSSSVNATDWTIWAQGANNDGNYVMMKLTYSVELSDGTYVSTSHNLLFKVTTEESKLTYTKSAANSTTVSSTSSTDGTKTYASNISDAYIISDTDFSSNSYTFYLYSSESSVINAYMRGTSTNSIYNFNFTYTVNVGTENNANGEATEYNSWSTVNSSDAFGGWSKNTSGTIYTATCSSEGTISITIPSILVLGEKYFYVEFMDNFGYTGRFYFTVQSSDNPTIYNISSSTITEGQNIVIGSRYTTLNPVTYENEMLEYDSFTYTSYTNNDGQTRYGNTLEISYSPGTVELSSGGTKNLTISAIYVYATINTSQMEATSGGVTTRSQVSSGETIYKVFSYSTSINIWSESDKSTTSATNDGLSDWLRSDGTSYVYGLLQSTLNGASITVRVVFESLSTSDTITALGELSITYTNGGDDGDWSDKILTQTYNASGTYSPSYTDANVDNYVSVTLQGISAYAFDRDDIKTVDKNSIENYTSKVNSIYVKSVDFYYNNIEEGEAKIDGSLETIKGTSVAQLITSEDCSFITSISSSGINMESGVSSSGYFTVPYFDGYLFGTGNTISNVTMRITLVDADGNECILTQTVTIQRAASDSLFTSTVLDGDSVYENMTSSAEVANDTLEVVLEAQESVSFVVHNGLISNLTEDGNGNYTFTSGGTTYDANVITITNTNDYAKTFYYSISECIVGLTKNLNSGDGIYLYVISQTLTDSSLSDVFLYNGSKVFSSDNTLTSFSIAGLASGALKLNIESLDELSSANTKTVSLYFLFKQNGEVYRTVKSFTVYPRYTSATATKTENNSIIVDDYYYVTNSTSTYYIITLSQWASAGNVTLTEGGSTGTKLLTSLLDSRYQFYFEIDSDSQGVAYIDENGMITTSEGFDIYNTVFVLNMYMKISGCDGQFQEDNTEILIGSFTIRLSAGISSTASTTGEGTYVTTDGNIITIPSDYTLYGASLSTTISVTVETGTIIRATTVGSTLNFNDLFDEYERYSSFTNKKFHLVSVYDTSSGTTTYYNFNNVGSWTFSSAGTYYVTLVLNYRNGSSYSQTAFTFRLLVYDDSTSATREEQYYMLKTEATNYFETTTESWWLLEDDNLTSEADSFSSTTDGIYNNRYLVLGEDGTSKIVTARFFVYSDTAYKSVALNQGTSYTLENLIDNKEDGHSYEIYVVTTTNGEVTSITQDYTDTVSGGAGTDVERQYLVVDYNSDGTVYKITLYIVRYKVVESGTNKTISAYIPFTETTTSGETIRTISQADVWSAVKEALGLNIDNDYMPEGQEEVQEGIFFTLQERDSSTNILTTAGDITVSSSVNALTKTYLVTYRATESGSINFVTVSITFYLYHTTASVNGIFNLEITTQPNTSFSMSNLDSYVRDIINEAFKYTGDDALTSSTYVSYYTLVNNSFTQVSSVDLQENQATVQYYVRVGDRYYLFNITLNVFDNYTNSSGTIFRVMNVDDEDNYVISISSSNEQLDLSNVGISTLLNRQGVSGNIEAYFISDIVLESVSEVEGTYPITITSGVDEYIVYVLVTQTSGTDSTSSLYKITIKLTDSTSA